MPAATTATSLVRRAWGEVRPTRGYERLLWWAGAVLLLSAVVHTGVWLASGDAWSGAVSWRKPVVFAASFGVTLPSLAWVLRHLPTARTLGGVLSVSLTASALAEVGLITMQRWRGVASHFNYATEFDAVVFALMGLTIGVFGAGTVAVLLWGAVRLRRAGPVAIAAIGGLVFLLVAQGLGAPLIEQGNAVAEVTGAAPEQVTIGAEGLGKLPHGLGIHALQALAALAVLVGLGGAGRREARRVMWTGVAGYAGLLGWAVAQTYLGRAPFDLTPASAASLIGSVVLLAAAYAQAIAGLRSDDTAPDHAPTREELTATVSA